MKKFAIAAATALTLTMAGGAFAQTANQATQAPMMLAANETVNNVKEETGDAWITTKVKADLLTEKGIPGTDITVETNNNVVSLSSKVTVTEAQKKQAVSIAKNVKGVTAVSADGLKAD